MPRVKPVLITGKPSETEIMAHWQKCFSILTQNGRHTALQSRVYGNLDNNDDPMASISEKLYKAMLEEGYLKLVKPDPMADGAEEYEMAMKGQRKFRSMIK